jgi:hypothetical protein
MMLVSSPPESRMESPVFRWTLPSMIALHFSASPALTALDNQLAPPRQAWQTQSSAPASTSWNAFLVASTLPHQHPTPRSQTKLFPQSEHSISGAVVPRVDSWGLKPR